MGAVTAIPEPAPIPEPARISVWARPRVRVAIAVPLIAGLLVLGLRLWLKWVGPFPGDEWALHHLESSTLPIRVVEIGTFFAAIGTPVIAALTLVAVLPAIVRSDGVRGVLFVGLAGTGVFFNMLLKELSGPTPLMLERVETFGVFAGEGLNYPSGHTVYGVVFFGSLAWLAWRHRRLDVVAPLVAVMLFMGPSRVIVEAHFVSDVLAAYLVGLAWLVPAAVITGQAAGRREPHRPQGPTARES